MYVPACDDAGEEAKRSPTPGRPKEATPAGGDAFK